MRKITVLLTVCIVASSILTSCGDRRQETRGAHRLKVVATLFPLFDFAGKIGGDKAEIVLLLPPGAEPHDFEPKPRDLATIQEADLFIYTGNAMEPWVQTILKGIDLKMLTVIDTSRGIALRRSEDDDHMAHGDKSHVSATEIDPHIWLDFSNAQIMVDNILAGFIKKDPENKDFYTQNASAYKRELRQLDDEYRKGLADCRTRLFLYGGHYAFNYLAQRYNLTYVSVHGLSPNAEPTPAHLIDMVNKMKQYNLKYIFYEEQASPRVAQTTAKETGAGLLPLNPAHNVTKDQIRQNITFIDIMKENLAMLRKGLQCR